MDILALLQSKPVLIGLHLGSAILGIDAFFWLLGKFKEGSEAHTSKIVTAAIGVGAFVSSWFFGGYYYVVYYGSVVKPVIKGGLAPWAHDVFMETKEHIFLFIVPLAVTLLFLALLDNKELKRLQLSSRAMVLAATVGVLGLLIGAMGFIISAAARWGA